MLNTTLHVLSTLGPSLSLGSFTSKQSPGLFCAGYARTGKTGGAYRDRTDDPLLAKQVLSQLS